MKIPRITQYLYRFYGCNIPLLKNHKNTIWPDNISNPKLNINQMIFISIFLFSLLYARYHDVYDVSFSILWTSIYRHNKIVYFRRICQVVCLNVHIISFFFSLPLWGVSIKFVFSSFKYQNNK